MNFSFEVSKQASNHMGVSDSSLPLLSCANNKVMLL